MIALKNFIKNFIVYTTWKDNDQYPSLIYNNSIFQRISEWSGFSWLRVKFWNFIAKKNKAFKGFYSDGINHTGNKRLDELFSIGFLIEENFLTEETFIKYQDIFQNKVDNYLNSNEYLDSNKKQIRIQLDFRPNEVKEFEDEMTRLMHPLVHEFYGNTRPIFRYEIDASKDGTDYRSALSKWHIDRPLPSLKVLYFPLGVNAAPFSYIKGSHLINKQWQGFESFFRSIKNYSKKGKSKKAMMLADNVELPLTDKLKDNIVELNNLRPNTLYLGAHQGLHRKKPFEERGYRFHLSIEFTHGFSKYNLISSALNRQTRS